MVPPAHDVSLNAEAKVMDFFRSSFAISTPVSQCPSVIRALGREHAAPKDSASKRVPSYVPAMNVSGAQDCSLALSDT
jgi:hypothetical protein